MSEKYQFVKRFPEKMIKNPKYALIYPLDNSGDTEVEIRSMDKEKFDILHQWLFKILLKNPVTETAVFSAIAKGFRTSEFEEGK